MSEFRSAVGQPGFYGRIDIGNAPPPVLIYPQPVVIQKVYVAQPPPPLYLHVPPGHAQKWSKHCHKYDACSRPVYFVKDDWYNNVYVPHYQQVHASSNDARATARARERVRTNSHDRLCAV